MRKALKVILLFFIVGVCCAESVFCQLDPDEILLAGKKRPKVLLVGSWHFNYPGLDAFQVDEKKRINIHSEKRQQEIIELVDYLALFRPTKIMVESGAITGYLNYNFKEWKAGRDSLYTGERSQVGMRLVERCRLDTIYGVNDGALLMDMLYDSSIKKIGYLDSIAERHYFGGNDEMNIRYGHFYDYEDTYQLNHSLLNGFRYMNSDKVLNRYFGAYIAGGQFISDRNEGPDALSMYWMNRNLRIFRNIQRIKTSEDDRILVLFGAGHVAILKWLFECSPQYELVKFDELGFEK